MNRRAFIGAGATVLAGGAGLIGYATQIEPHWLELVERKFPIANLPAELEGKTLAQISDIHVCSYVDEAYLTRSLQRVAAFVPDMVVVTGDFVSWEESRSERIRAAELNRVYSHLPQGKIATIGILGNHDYGHSWKDPRIALQITTLVSAHGIHILRNETMNVRGLDFVGIDDLWSGRADTRAAFAQRSADRAIALCHNPDGLDDLPWEGFSGWVLAGHTHGGQCKPPFLPPPILPVVNRRYTAGRFELDGHRRLYINRALGHLTKVRFNVRPEITMHRLRVAPA